MIVPKKDPTYRATFTGMKLPQTEKNILVTMSGALAVEIFVNHDLYGNAQKWQARLLPTLESWREKFKGMFD